MWGHGEVFKIGGKEVPKELVELFKHEQDTAEEIRKVFTKEFSNNKININSGRGSMDGRIKSANNR